MNICKLTSMPEAELRIGSPSTGPLSWLSIVIPPIGEPR